ncbi:hypothetical protein EVAR_21247_1 [Eumeta japonica]|uniref:Uncharacterized protein n=1 Tax=Eumeta variegata TaxID=151549 RepID=A0A4C1Z4P3_EUMVA|nr:hypothetical protein EVAR_21247_1 [Eumeta japonica]
MEATGCRLAMTGHKYTRHSLWSISVSKTVARRDLRAPLPWGCVTLRLDFGIITPSTSTCFPHVVIHTPSTIDIALTKGVALNFNSIETIHGLTSDRRPERVSTTLEEIDTPNLNSIPNDIASTDEIDFGLGALTNHVRTVVEGERAGILGSPEVSTQYSRIDKSKNAALRRASMSHTRVQIQSASSPTRSGCVREFRNES